MGVVQGQSVQCTAHFAMIVVTCRSLRLVAQDAGLSRRKQGFESPRERQAEICPACALPVRCLEAHGEFGADAEVVGLALVVARIDAVITSQGQARPPGDVHLIRQLKHQLTILRR